MAYEAGVSGTPMLSAALEALERAAVLDPATMPDALKTAREAAAREEAWARAATAREGAPPRAPAAQGTYAAYRAAGEQADREGDPELAIANYARAEAVAGNARQKAAAANLQGLVALARRRPAEARACFARATELNPESKYGWNNLGVALLRAYDADAGGRELVEAAAAAFARVAELDTAYKPENLAWARGLLTELGPAPETTTAVSTSGTLAR